MCHRRPNTYKNVPPPYSATFPGYYSQNYTHVYTTPGYTVENTEVVVETLLYRLPDGMPVWSGTTRSLNPQSKSELAQAITYLIGDELKQNRLLGTPGK
jgi:hypothetical protein